MVKKEKRIGERQVRALARQVRERLVTKGWKQWGMGGDNGPNCLLGAIDNEVEGGWTQPLAVTLELRLKNLIRRWPDSPHCDITDWNDHRGRTKRQVLDLLRSVERGYGRRPPSKTAV